MSASSTDADTFSSLPSATSAPRLSPAATVLSARVQLRLVLSVLNAALLTEAKRWRRRDEMTGCWKIAC